MGQQLRRPLRRDVARTGRIEHQAERIGAGRDRGGKVLLAGNAADLDSGTGHKFKEDNIAVSPAPTFSCQTGS